MTSITNPQPLSSFNDIKEFLLSDCGSRLLKEAILSYDIDDLKR